MADQSYSDPNYMMGLVVGAARNLPSSASDADYRKEADWIVNRCGVDPRHTQQIIDRIRKAKEAGM